MKKKEVTKKLSLNKKTISNLNESEMDGIYGGSFVHISCAYPPSNTVPQSECTCTTSNTCESLEVACD